MGLHSVRETCGVVIERFVRSPAQSGLVLAVSKLLGVTLWHLKKSLHLPLKILASVRSFYILSLPLFLAFCSDCFYQSSTLQLRMTAKPYIHRITPDQKYRSAHYRCLFPHKFHQPSITSPTGAKTILQNGKN